MKLFSFQFGNKVYSWIKLRNIKDIRCGFFLLTLFNVAIV